MVEASMTEDEMNIRGDSEETEQGEGKVQHEMLSKSMTINGHKTSSCPLYGNE